MISKYLHKLAGGLELNPHLDLVFNPKRRDNENHILFFCEYILLKHMLTNEVSLDDYKLFEELEANLSVEGYPGLYHRGYGALKLNGATGEIVDISHDNITAIVCLRRFFSKHNPIGDIIAHAHKYNWRFDNVYPNSPRLQRTLHPRDIIFLSYVNGNLWASMLLPLLTLMAIMSCVSKWVVRPTLYQKIWDHFFHTGLSAPYRDINTSGKCLWFVRLYTMRDKAWARYTYRLCNLLMKLRTNMSFIDAMKLYFMQRTTAYHPNIELCDKINARD